MVLIPKKSIGTKKLVLLWKCITMIIKINNPIVLAVTLLYLLPFDLKENKKKIPTSNKDSEGKIIPLKR